MKITVDLPDELLRRLKLRALREKKKLKDAVADLLRAGLAPDVGRRVGKPPLVVKDRESGLPVIQCRRAAPRERELTPADLAELLLGQEVEWARESA